MINNIYNLIQVWTALKMYRCRTGSQWTLRVRHDIVVVGGGGGATDGAENTEPGNDGPCKSVTSSGGAALEAP